MPRRGACAAPWLWNLWLKRCGHSRSPSNLLVGSAAATARATLNGSGATARAPASRPTTLEEGRSCFGVGPTRKPVLKGQRLFAAGCLRPRAGLAPLVQDGEAGPRAGLCRPGHPADSLTPQDRWCSPYPHSTGPGPTRQGSRTHTGRTPASDCWLNHVAPGGMLNHPRGHLP